ncbi:MAG: hypothetical protein ACRDGV_04655, partial [Candidatus Limnocylindria bacterium]
MTAREQQQPRIGTMIVLLLGMLALVALAATSAFGHDNFRSFGGGADCPVYGHQHRDIFYTGNG